MTTTRYSPRQAERALAKWAKCYRTRSRIQQLAEGGRKA